MPVPLRDALGNSSPCSRCGRRTRPTPSNCHRFQWVPDLNAFPRSSGLTKRFGPTRSKTSPHARVPIPRISPLPIAKQELGPTCSPLQDHVDCSGHSRSSSDSGHTADSTGYARTKARSTISAIVNGHRPRGSPERSKPMTARFCRGSDASDMPLDDRSQPARSRSFALDEVANERKGSTEVPMVRRTASTCVECAVVPKVQLMRSPWLARNCERQTRPRGVACSSHSSN